jgi:hypothetical protein
MNEKELKAYKLNKLKETATELGIEYSANIGLDSLLKKVIEVASDFDEKTLEPSGFEIEDGNEKSLNTIDLVVNPGKKITPEMQFRFEALKVIKCTVYNLDTQDSDKTTGYARISNEVIDVARIIPFGVPVGLEQCLVDKFKRDKMIIYVAEKDKHGQLTGNKTHKEVPKYNIEIH